MIASLNIIDNLFQDAGHLRSYALEMDFSKPPEFDGVLYPGFSPIKDKAVIEYLEQCISEAMGCSVNIDGACVTAGTETLSTQQWIHSDNTCAPFAGVIYLFDKPGFGTAFWKHKETQAEGLIEYVSNTDSTPEVIAATLQAHGSDESKWDRTDYAESKYNRLIFYPSDRFHSRYPEVAFGDAPSNCRLTIALFFSIT